MMISKDLDRVEDETVDKLRENFISEDVAFEQKAHLPSLPLGVTILNALFPGGLDLPESDTFTGLPVPSRSPLLQSSGIVQCPLNSNVISSRASTKSVGERTSTRRKPASTSCGFRLRTVKGNDGSRREGPHTRFAVTPSNIYYRLERVWTWYQPAGDCCADIAPVPLELVLIRTSHSERKSSFCTADQARRRLPRANSTYVGRTGTGIQRQRGIPLCRNAARFREQSGNSPAVAGTERNETTSAVIKPNVFSREFGARSTGTRSRRPGPRIRSSDTQGISRAKKLITNLF